MDFCENCGKVVPDRLKFCPYCGAYIDKPECRTFWYGILSFFVPIIGVILYLVWRKEKPKAAKSAITGWLLNVFSKALILIIVFAFSIFVAIKTDAADGQTDTTHKASVGINDYDYDYGTYYGEESEDDDYDIDSYYTTEGFDYDNSYNSLLTDDAFDDYDDNYFSDYFGYDY